LTFWYRDSEGPPGSRRYSWLRAQVEGLRPWPSVFTISGTIGIAIIGSLCVLHLALLPPPEDDSIRWGYFDKRWIIALYGLGVVLIYFPAAMKRFLDTWTDHAPNLPQITAPDTATNLFWRIAAVTSCGFLLAFLDISPMISDGLVKYWEEHELVHLGPLQKLAQGAVPYVGAKTQYGPGHQLVTYLMMGQTEFTLRGFRASFFVLNIVAEGILFSVVLYSLGWAVGLVAILFSRLFCPDLLLGFVGWFVQFRWLGPLLVGLLLPLVIWSDRSRRSSAAAVAVIGGIGGVLAWFSQENFSTCLVTGLLIFCASFARGQYSLGTTVLLLGMFALSHVLSFLILLSATVGAANVPEALNDAFRIGALWARGLGNTPWTPWPGPESPWTIAFYLTPFLVIILTGVGLWAPIHCADTHERMLGRFLGIAAAAASLVPITLLRSDDAHFLGASIALPFLIVLAGASLPGRLTTCRRRKELIRAVLLLLLIAIYIVPQNGRASISRLLPDFEGAWDGAVALAQIGNPPKNAAGVSFFESRLGFRCQDGENPMRLGFRSASLLYVGMPCGGGANVDEIRVAVGRRTVYVDIPLDDQIRGSSTLYFFADLNPATATPEVLTTIWTKRDVEDLRAVLARQPPECVISWGGHLAPMLQQAFGSYTTVAVRNGAVYCRNRS
jgi:hypothetical protein